jgi:hypothetical protein
VVDGTVYLGYGWKPEEHQGGIVALGVPGAAADGAGGRRGLV